MTFAVERVVAPAAEMHGRALDDAPTRAVRLCRATAPALVLGSAQPEADVDAERAAAAGVAVVRRRSGGGAVLVEPGHLVWVDVVVPAGDPLWDDDVGRAFWWLGDAWASALRSLGVDAAVHRGGLVATPWSRRVCFAGLGPGEVTAGSRKVVGMSQRRTRTGALFQCAALLAWRPERLVALLALEDEERTAAVAELAGAATPVPATAAAVEAAILATLPTDGA